MTTELLYNAITKENQDCRNSYYAIYNDVTLLRVSNHLPRVSNIEESEEIKNVVLVIVSDKITESEIESFITFEMGNYNVEYYLISEKEGYSELDVRDIKNSINCF
ncbi:MAG: hypothetical protein WC389_19670 [Lutibacter sp.]|jgi:hypothetical protein